MYASNFDATLYITEISIWRYGEEEKSKIDLTVKEYFKKRGTISGG